MLVHINVIYKYVAVTNVIYIYTCILDTKVSPQNVNPNYYKTPQHSFESKSKHNLELQIL